MFRSITHFGTRYHHHRWHRFLSSSGLQTEFTPLLRSLPMSKRFDKSIFLKMDSFRPSGSFKDRGIGRQERTSRRRNSHAGNIWIVGLKCFQLSQSGCKWIVSSSGGNAGLAVAHCGRVFDIPVTVVVPTSTKPLMLDRIRLQGAEVCHNAIPFTKLDHATRLSSRKRSSKLSDSILSPHP